MISDTSQNTKWPERHVTAIREVENELDEFECAAHIDLDCGHYFVRTFDDPKHQPYEVGDTVRCRICHVTRNPLETKEIVH